MFEFQSSFDSDLFIIHAMACKLLIQTRESSTVIRIGNGGMTLYLANTSAKLRSYIFFTA